MPKVNNIKNSLPTYDAMMNPLLQAMKELGGSGTVEEINSKVADILGLRDEQLEIAHDSKHGGRTEFEYRLAWTRSYLKRYGILQMDEHTPHYPSRCAREAAMTPAVSMNGCASSTRKKL
jgi:restriction endonuclease Mrr